MCLVQVGLSSKKKREIFVPSLVANGGEKRWCYCFNSEALNYHFATMDFVTCRRDAHFNVPLLFWRVLYTYTFELSRNGISHSHSYALNSRNSYRPKASVYITVPAWGINSYKMPILFFAFLFHDTRLLWKNSPKCAFFIYFSVVKCEWGNIVWWYMRR